MCSDHIFDPMPFRREKVDRSVRWLLVILLLAVAIRVVYLYQYHGSPSWEQLTVDNWYHHHWAQSIADGNLAGDTTYFRAPLYVYCLGALYALFGSSLWVGRLFGLAVGLASICMTWVLGRRMLGRWEAVAAAALHAALPIVMYFEVELLLDPLFMLLLQIALWRCLIWLESERRIDLFWAGLTLGLASICRPTALVIAALVAGWVLFKRPSARRLRGLSHTLGRLAVYGVGLAVCLGPILIRNLVVAGDPVLIASQGGINLYIGNNPTSDGLSAVLPEPMGYNWRIRQIAHLAEAAEKRALKPGEVSAYWERQAWEWIRAHPSAFASLTARKLAFLLANREIPNERSIDSHFASFPILGRNPLVFGLILPPALLGIVVLWRRRPGVRFLVAAMVVFMAGMALFFVNSRFRLPLMPLYCLLAVGGLFWIGRSFRERSWLPVAAVVPMIIVGWLSFDPPVRYPQNWSVQNLTSRGLYLYARGQWHEAAEVFRVAADLQPGFPEVNLNLGAAYLRLGRIDSARACFEREMREHPLRYKAYQNLASIHLLENDFSRAVELAETALRLAPYDKLSHLVRIRALAPDSEVDENRLARAIDEAAGATDDDLEVLSEGGAFLLSRNATSDAAVALLRRAESARPPAIETNDNAFSAEFADRLADFERRRATSLHLLGYALANRGRLSESELYSRRAIAADSGLVPAYLNLYNSLALQNRVIEADSVFDEAVHRFPDHPLIRAALEGRR